MPDVTIVKEDVSSTVGNNILFLGDGFSADDERLFWDVVEEFKFRFFRFVKPYDLAGNWGGVEKSIKKMINIYAAFTPTPASTPLPDASGVSLEPSLRIDATGQPVQPANPNIGRLIAKSSFFGFEYDLGIWFPRSIQSRDVINFVFGTTITPGLTHPTEPAGATAIPYCWDVTTPPAPSVIPYWGKDKGLIIVLINEDVDGANTLPHPDPPNKAYGVAVSIAPGESNFNITGPGVFGPGVMEFPHTPRPRPVRRIARIMRHALKYNQINDNIAHELGHSRFNLGDEYQGMGRLHDPDAGAGLLVGAHRVPYDEPNITGEAQATDAGNFTKVKWKADMRHDAVLEVEGPGPFQTNVCAAMDALVAAGGAPVVPDDAGTGFPPAPLARLVRYPWQMIGLYEGAKYQQCGVYRPAGNCKMRAPSDLFSRHGVFRQIHFCYVCKKTIIEELDPSMVPLLRLKQYSR